MSNDFECVGIYNAPTSITNVVACGPRFACRFNDHSLFIAGVKSVVNRAISAQTNPCILIAGFMLDTFSSHNIFRVSD